MKKSVASAVAFQAAALVAGPTIRPAAAAAAAAAAAFTVAGRPTPPLPPAVHVPAVAIAGRTSTAMHRTAAGVSISRTRRGTHLTTSSTSRVKSPSLSSLAASADDGELPRRETSTSTSSSGPLSGLLRAITLYAPLWTVLSAFIGLTTPHRIGPTLGSLPVVSSSLKLLMLAMGLTITPAEFGRAVRSPGVLTLNALCCFGLMPLLSVFVANILNCDPSQAVGTILLGCVSGGQASNLFALLAGGDVSLSVVCTLSTTLLGVVTTPLLVKSLLGCTIAVDGVGVLSSVTELVLGPLLTGLALGRLAPKLVSRVSPFCPAVGVGATLLLVAGGAANSASALLGSSSGAAAAAAWKTAAASSTLLPLLGGMAALLLAVLFGLSEPSKRTLVVEVLSKSPTLAYVLALRHFEGGAAAVPAAAMVSLAVLGAAVASAWTLFDPRASKDVASS